MPANRKKGEPDVPWPFEEPEPPKAPEPYKLRSERPQPQTDEPEEPQLAEAPGGPRGSYFREVTELRQQMATIPQLSGGRAVAKQGANPGREGRTPRASQSPRAGQTEGAPQGSGAASHTNGQANGTQSTPSADPSQPQSGAVAVAVYAGGQPNGSQLALSQDSSWLQLAVVPAGLPGGKLQAELKAKAKEVLVFPQFLGREAPQVIKPDAEIVLQFSAKPFWEDASAESKAQAEGSHPPNVSHLFRRQRRISWGGMLAMLFYVCALGFYLWIRITKTLGLGPYIAYGIIVLLVEILGASTVVVYGVNLLFETVVPEHEASLAYETREKALQRKLKEPYHVRVLIPCYKESLEILQPTIMGALAAELHAGCSKTVYLCDDGRDPEKQKWVETLGPEVQYVSGRKRPVGEMNGKSGNLNSCAAQLYPPGCTVPSNELMCIFDADQVAGLDFFLRTIPLFDGGSDVGMVLSPQCFHNLNNAADVFNHGNVHFWEYMQPGYDALGFISCTGTNFLTRAHAFIDAGGSPTYTLTEDYALGMEMLKRQWHCRYVPNYLVVGEAPEQIRNAMQQRSRWVKGHFQIMFSWQHCPLFQWKLPIFMRIMYCSGVWNYITGAISTPLFIVVPMITIWFGIFPIIISWWMALALTIYMAAMHSVMYNIHKVQHVQALWFANCCNSNLWWVYSKAIYRALMSAAGGSGIKFKTTVKGGNVLRNSALRDIWMPMLVLGFLLASIVGGLVKIGMAYTFPTPLAISILWAGYQAVPPFLIIAYVLLTPNGQTLTRVCLVALLVSFACGITAVSLLWHSTYADYNYASVAKASTFFHRVMMVGSLPAGYDVPWRSNALLQEATSGPAGADITGGWLTGVMAGNLKMTLPAAYSTALLAWGLLSFPAGYAKQPKATASTAQQVQWGADYLLRTISPATGGGYNLVYQVGNYSVDQNYWGRPEDITGDRPFYAVPLNVPTAGSSAVDLGGAVAGALLAAYAAIPTAPNAALYLSQGLAVYHAAAASASASQASYNYATATSRLCGVGALAVSAANCSGDGSALYTAVTYNDFLLWAAAWGYRATSNTSLLADAQTWQQNYIQNELAAGLGSPVINWSDMYWAANMMLSQATNITTYGGQIQALLRQWICNTLEGVTLLRMTDRGRIFAYADPALSTTANTAFVAVAYATLLKPLGDPRARTYTCWALQQIRYMLGDGGRSLVVGIGSHPPKFPNVQSASCPSPPATCLGQTAEFSGAPNPQVAKGSLIYGDSANNDVVSDDRIYSANMAGVEYNAGFQAALAGLAQYDLNWYNCKINYGITVTDQTFCATLKREGG